MDNNGGYLDPRLNQALDRVVAIKTWLDNSEHAQFAAEVMQAKHRGIEALEALCDEYDGAQMEMFG